MATTGKKNKKIKNVVVQKQNPLLQYTPEQRTKLLLTPCKNKADFKRWIELHLELKLPDTTVSRYADTNPLDAIWEIYDICVNCNNPTNISELLLVAGRGSGKCSSKNTIILTNNGLKYIQNIKVGDIVYTGWDWQPVAQTFDEGIKAGVKITTATSTLTGSLKHRIQAINDNGILDWIFMKDLVIGQLVYKCSEDLKVSFEQVESIEFKDDYFYDLEISTTHSYWSNGFISHNTLGMAIVEFMVILHDQRDVVHVGAIQNQADRCYNYIRSFIYNKQLKDIMSPPNVKEGDRILERANIGKSIYNVDNKKVIMEVLPCTLKACLCTDSRLLVPNGVLDITSIKEGDIVCTPIGNKKTLYNDIIEAECMEVLLDDGRIIRGTLNHKVLTQRGFVELQNLMSEDDIL